LKPPFKSFGIKDGFPFAVEGQWKTHVKELGAPTLLNASIGRTS